MKKLILSVLVSMGLIGAVYGAAASLGGVTAPALGSSSAVIGSCGDPDGVDVAYTISGGKLTTVTVSDIDGTAVDDCDGKNIGVELTDTNGASIAVGEDTVPSTLNSDPESIAVSVTGPTGDVDAEDVFDVHVHIADALNADASVPEITVP